MLYYLSCFFRDLAVGSDKSMNDAWNAKLRGMNPLELAKLLDAVHSLRERVEAEIVRRDEE